MSVLRAAIAALLFLFAAPGVVAQSTAVPRVPTTQGLAEGTVAEGVAVFKGLPYAAPPVGDLRWRAPADPPAWSGVREAKAFGAACMQKPELARAVGDPSPLAEDCLYLNVWTPRAESGAGLPVMVFIHGGAYVFGSGAQPVYDGTPLARRGVVVVSLNYRLGVFGFFAHPALDAEQRGATPLSNFGLMDQVAALRWVRSNVSAFGGDPSRVTLFGESAGAMSVLSLYASPLARGLFAGGIAQSAYGIPAHGRTKARAVGVAVASALGLRGAGATLDELRSIGADRIVALGDDGAKGLSLTPVAVVGDSVLPEAPLQAFKRGRQAAAPLVIGSNSDEASVALAFGLEPAALVRRLGAARILVRPLYPQDADEAELGRGVVRDVVFTAFARRIASLHAGRAPTWRYYYSRLADGARADSAFGVEHAGELASVFGTGDTCACVKGGWSEADRDASRALGDRWVAFARGGPPDAGRLPAWTRDSRAASRVMEFGDSTELRSDFMARRMRAFNTAIDLAGLFARPGR